MDEGGGAGHGKLMGEFLGAPGTRCTVVAKQQLERCFHKRTLKSPVPLSGTGPVLHEQASYLPTTSTMPIAISSAKMREPMSSLRSLTKIDRLVPRSNFCSDMICLPK